VFTNKFVNNSKDKLGCFDLPIKPASPHIFIDPDYSAAVK